MLCGKESKSYMVEIGWSEIDDRIKHTINIFFVPLLQDYVILRYLRNNKNKTTRDGETVSDILYDAV